MIQRCSTTYRAGAGRPDLPSCGRVFDDAERSTICPHRPLGTAYFDDVPTVGLENRPDPEALKGQTPDVTLAHTTDTPTDESETD